MTDAEAVYQSAAKALGRDAVVELATAFNIYTPWTTTPPTETGWYWAMVKSMPDFVRMVYHTRRAPNDFKFGDTGRLAHKSVFTHWLGPLREPGPPTDAA